MAAAAPYGLAPLNGSAPSVGAVAYTLGGGLGILARQFGYAADHVRSLDVVTGDGRLRHVTRDSEPGLYRGLLGGGRGLGIVTGMEIGLVPVRTLYGGSLAFDGREVDPAAVLRAWVAWTATVPKTLTSSFAAVPYPDLPALPPQLRGRYAVPWREGRFLVRLLAAGERAAARAVLDPAFALLAPRTLGRSLNFAFGAGDRADDLHDPETAKRLAGLRSQYDPANLFGR
jgi:FAD/FMN-containing dehydrogenase